MCLVDIILRTESNGNSSIRGVDFSRADLCKLNWFANATNATSVGSPKTPSSTVALLQSDIPEASKRKSASLFSSLKSSAL